MHRVSGLSRAANRQSIHHNPAAEAGSEYLLPAQHCAEELAANATRGCGAGDHGQSHLQQDCRREPSAVRAVRLAASSQHKAYGESRSGFPGMEGRDERRCGNHEPHCCCMAA